ncbi:MAG: two-component system LytT family sensor kinase [Flavobacteriales bacterium]|jgi:two-component system LytT family sensor kinase
MTRLSALSTYQWPTPKFWHFQIMGWMAYPFAIYILFTPKDGEVTFYSGIVYYSIEMFLGFLLTLVLRQIHKYYWNKPVWVSLLVGFFSVVLVAEIWTAVKLLAFFEIFPNQIETGFWETNRAWFSNSLTIVAAWSAIYYSLKYRSSLVKREKALLVALAAEKEAQLLMLRYQLNPHFLFNTLANVCALISDDNSKKASEITQKLSGFLRYTLDKDPSKTNDLRAELSVLNLYLDIEKIRYSKRLNCLFSISEDTLDFQIPSMLLQPIVENSIKHAIAPSTSDGHIVIESAIVNDALIISVSDDGPGMNVTSCSNKKQVGIGMKNTRERLEGFYGLNHSLEYINIESGGLEVRISIHIEALT